MPEILFRGKRLDNGEWVEGDLFQHDDGEREIFVHKPCLFAGKSLEGRWYQVDPATVGQYTGLTGKNGVLVFEGDLLLINGIKRPVQVKFEDFSWGCASEALGPYYWHRLMAKSSKYEVIGNIHDNQEPMEGGAT